MSASQPLGKDDLSHLGINEAALDNWTRAQLFHVVDFCHQHSWSVYRVDEQKSKILPGVLAVWQISFTSHHKSKTVWIISGDVPTDVIPQGSSETARQATLCFSKKFLLKAQRLREQIKKINSEEVESTESADSNEQSKHKVFVDETGKNNLEVWVKSAANLLVLYHEETLW